MKLHDILGSIALIFTLLVNNVSVNVSIPKHTNNQVDPAPAPKPEPKSEDDPVIAVIDDKLVPVQGVLDPKVAVSGAEKPIDAGELVILKPTLKDDYPTYVKNKSVKWDIKNKNFYQDGDNVFFGAGIKNPSIDVGLDISLDYAVNDKIVTKKIHSDQTVSVNLPEPPKPPDPPAPPVPLTATETFIINSFSLYVTPDIRVAAAQALSAGFADSADNAHLYSPNNTGIGKLLKYTHDTNNAKLTGAGIDPKRLDTWFGTGGSGPLQDWLYGKFQSGELKTINDFGQLFKDISAALLKVK